MKHFHNILHRMSRVLPSQRLQGYHVHFGIAARLPDDDSQQISRILAAKQMTHLLTLNTRNCAIILLYFILDISFMIN